MAPLGRVERRTLEPSSTGIAGTLGTDGWRPHQSAGRRPRTPHRSSRSPTASRSSSQVAPGCDLRVGARPRPSPRSAGRRPRGRPRSRPAARTARDHRGLGSRGELVEVRGYVAHGTRVGVVVRGPGRCACPSRRRSPRGTHAGGQDHGGDAGEGPPPTTAVERRGTRPWPEPSPRTLLCPARAWPPRSRDRAAGRRSPGCEQALGRGDDLLRRAVESSGACLGEKLGRSTDLANVLRRRRGSRRASPAARSCGACFDVSAHGPRVLRRRLRVRLAPAGISTRRRLGTVLALAALLAAPARALAVPTVDGQFLRLGDAKYLALGPDGNIWVTLGGGGSSSRVTPAGAVTE